jgi:hypothetical protein
MICLFFHAPKTVFIFGLAVAVLFLFAFISKIWILEFFELKNHEKF